MALNYSILDQSPISEGSSPQEALKQTAILAQKAEQWGYTRFWVSEHHDATTLAGSSPEVLIAHLGAVTKTIRLGSGGVMLPHYAPFKIAENFKLLEALYPDRIDAGVGRAPGGMPRASYALNEGKKRDTSKFPAQIDDLRMYLTDSIPEEHPYYGMKATPVTKHSPPIWVLGSSENSAQLAADKGLPICSPISSTAKAGSSLPKNTVNASSPIRTVNPMSALLFLWSARKHRNKRNE